MNDLISKRDAIKSMANAIWHYPNELYPKLNAYENAKDLAIHGLQHLPSAQPERLTDDDFETIRIHLNAQKEKLCNQQRWEEAEEYQRIIDRFMAFASAEPERKTGEWIYYDSNGFQCSRCRRYLEISCGDVKMNFCPHCGSYNRGEQE